MPKDSSAKQSRSSKPSSSHSKTNKETGSSHRHRHASANGPEPPLSFLFVINEVNARTFSMDSWGNRCPPDSPSGYDPEIPGMVMRYQGGVIDALPREQFHWIRNPEEGNYGSICWFGSDGNWHPADTYDTATILSCHPLMPVAMVNVDATIFPTSYSFDYNAGREGNRQVWQPLLFFHPQDERLRGVSQAVFKGSMLPEQAGGNPVKYAAGRGHVLKSLLPLTYLWPYEHPPTTRGLGGELTLLLGLMAFSSPESRSGRNRADSIFPGRHGKWQNHRWLDDQHPRGYLPSDNHLPKGFIVTVAMDPLNPEGSTPDRLKMFEFHSIPIRE